MLTSFCNYRSIIIIIVAKKNESEIALHSYHDNDNFNLTFSSQLIHIYLYSIYVLFSSRVV